MPQAPGLTPTIAPSGSIPEINLPVPTDAFGGAVGAALQHMGAGIESSSSEIFQRAMQLQDIQNRTEVDNADAEFIKQTALKHAEFNAKYGQNAGPEALAQHIQDVTSIRDNIRNGLSNPMSQRMFNSTSLNTMSRYIANASNHSATEVRSAYRQGLVIRGGALADEFANNPNDPTVRRTFRANQEITAREKGLDEKDIPTYVNNAESAVNVEIANRMANKAKTVDDLTAAKDWIENAHKKGLLEGKNYDDALTNWKTVAYHTAPDLIASKINADLKNQTDPSLAGATEQERIQQARSEAEKNYPDLPLMPTAVENAVRRSFNGHLGAIRDLNHRDRELAADILEGHYSPNGKAPTTMDEIKAAPGGADMLSRMSKNFSTFGKIQRALLRNSEGVYLPTRENTDEYHKLIGQLTSEDPAERSKGMDVFIPELQMPKDYKTRLRQLQDQLYKGTPQDPRIGAAIRDLAPSLEGMNKDDLNRFRGAFTLIVQGEMAKAQGKALPLEETRKIGARLLQNIPGRFPFGLTDSKLFEQQIPNDLLEKVKRDAEIQGDVITDEQAQAIYTKGRYKELLEAAKGKLKEGLQR